MEADDALRVIEARRAGGWWTETPERIGLNATDAERFLDAIDSSERSEPGLRRLSAKTAPGRDS